MVELNKEYIDKDSFESVGYTSYSEHMRTPKSLDEEGSSKFKYYGFHFYVVFSEVRLEIEMKFIKLEDFKNDVKDTYRHYIQLIKQPIILVNYIYVWFQNMKRGGKREILFTNMFSSQWMRGILKLIYFFILVILP